MTEPIDTAIFANMTAYDVERIEAAARLEPSRGDLIQKLLEYINLWAGRGWIDSEKLYLLGWRIGNVWPLSAVSDLREVVRSAANKSVSHYFLEGLDDIVNERTAVPTAPTKAELNKTLQGIPGKAFMHFRPELEDLLTRSLRQTQRTGEATELVFNVLSVYRTMLRSRYYQHDTLFSLEWLGEGLRWKPQDLSIWLAVAQAYALCGSSEASELIFWDLTRRWPNNPIIRSQLIEAMMRDPNRSAEVRELAKQSTEQFPTNGFLRNQFARLLLHGGEPDAVGRAAALLETAISQRRQDGKRPEPTDVGVLADAYVQLHLAGESAESIEHRIKRVAGSDVRLQYFIAYSLADRDDGIELSAHILRVLARESPDEPSVSNQLAGVLVRKGETGIDEAISVLRTTTRTFREDRYSRIQLIRALAARGREGDRAKAIRLLRLTTRKFPRDKMFDVDPNELGIATQKLGIAAQKLESEQDQPGDIALSEADRTKAMEIVSGDVFQYGRARALRFRMERGGETAAAAFAELQASLASNNVPKEYAEILAIRQGIWRVDDQTLPTFAAAFELALTQEDIEAVRRLADKMPRLEALTLVARAIFGDAKAAEAAAEWLRQPAPDEPNIIVMFRSELRSIRQTIQRGVRPDVAFASSKVTALRAVRDANEAALGFAALAA